MNTPDELYNDCTIFQLTRGKMPTFLPALSASRQSGEEPFTLGGTALSFDVKSFWRWAFSDFVSNTSRGVLAEYIVARAVGMGVTDIRPEWAPFDITTPEGIKLEVKSAAYIQSWEQKDYSAISFSVQKKRGWDKVTGLEVNPQRHADVYVMALLHHKEQASINPLNLDQWSFYVVPRRLLDERQRSQHSITMASLDKLPVPVVGYLALYDAVKCAFLDAASA